MNPATMTPEQLAEHGISVIVALRARLDSSNRQQGERPVAER
jgi:hypothetical protein